MLRNAEEELWRQFLMGVDLLVGPGVYLHNHEDFKAFALAWRNSMKRHLEAGEGEYLEPRGDLSNDMEGADEPLSSLSETAFEVCPIWKWTDDHEAYCPVWVFEPLPDDVTPLFIRARFKTGSGHSFNGYLVGSDSFYAFALFWEGEEYPGNVNLPDFNLDIERKLSAKLGESVKLFPLWYETDFHFPDNPRLAGFIQA